MLEFRLRQPFVFPARTPLLNRAHPLFSQAHFTNAAVAQGKSLVDLVTGQVATNTTTLSGFDENGPYIWSNDAAGTATVTLTAPSTTFNFVTWGCIFKIVSNSGRGYVYTPASTTGIFIINSTVEFVLNNGAYGSFQVTPGHTYFAFSNNSVATASQRRTAVLVDLSNGQVFISTSASSANIILNPQALVPYSTSISTARLYASFASGSVLVPPAVQPASCFYSIDQIMSGLSNPWNLWYG